VSGTWTDGGWTLIWDECEDCNANGVEDRDDILSGTSLDVDEDGIPDECEYDCDADGVTDPMEIQTGTQHDIDGNGHPDECECIGDLDGDGFAASDDLLLVISQFGAAGGAADLDDDGVVGINDLLAVLLFWGPCS